VTVRDAADGQLRQAEIKILEGDKVKVSFDGFKAS
jgi:translation initiation factor IF-1